MTYDDWKTESREDEDYRLHRHEHGPRFDVEVGHCRGCDQLTERHVAGLGWQCKPCAEIALRRQFAARKAS